MDCPSCRHAVAFQPNAVNLGVDPVKGNLQTRSMLCPNCGRMIVVLWGSSGAANGIAGDVLIWPRSTGRPPTPAEVPEAIANDYAEACLVLHDSPKASAALSRRCLQHILRDRAGVKAGNLADEIDQVLGTKTLPGGVAEALDAVREIGNFAAHPNKSTSSGEVIDVEPDEADWNLDVVESLMDIYYVQPVRMAAKKAALNQKLADAGKKPV
jgi:uncharacterized protein DUF4145